jgi:hypothetical protein
VTGVQTCALPISFRNKPRKSAKTPEQRKDSIVAAVRSFGKPVGPITIMRKAKVGTDYCYRMLRELTAEGKLIAQKFGQSYFYTEAK